MIYFDNSATTLQKPNTVFKALGDEAKVLGNAGRSFYEPAILASKCIFKARREIAKLVGLENPMQIAFTSNATESLNLVLNSLVNSEDEVLTTVLEHNSVLRPLYHIGCKLDFIPCDSSGNLIYEELDKYIGKDIKCLVATHGSNVVGNITDVRRLYDFCKENDIIFILDAAQTLGSIEVNASMADVICFTGHKSLFGPQGTGGIIAREGIEFRVVKTGGSGNNSFLRTQSLKMPDIFEVGTMNAHSIAGLVEGVKFLNELGIEKIVAHHKNLSERFLNGLKQFPEVRIYGDLSSDKRLPVFAINIGSIPSDDIASELWEEHRIATRSGAHCAPLVHEQFGTVEQGMIRFSMSYFNTLEEVDRVLQAIKTIIER